MAAPSNDEVSRELAELPARPADERAAYLMSVGWDRLGCPTDGLEPFLDDSDPLVRVAAAQARWQTAHRDDELERLVGLLAEGLASDDEDLSLAAGTALVQMEDDAVAPLIRRFADGGKQDARIVRVLGEIAGDGAMETLRRAAASPHPDVADEARGALHALADERTREQ